MNQILKENNPILKLDDLSIKFDTPDGVVSAVNNVSLELAKGECLGIVGESGSGKSQVFLSVMGLLAKNGRLSGSIKFHDDELTTMSVKRLNDIRGVKMSMIFQDPMTSLNPYLRISKQMNEVLVEHQNLSTKQATEKAIHMLNLVGIPEAGKRFTMYPHEFSGGMRQRVMIAMALLCEPELIIADEPTTALDVTIQAQILDLIVKLKDELQTSIVLITHDLGVVAGVCDRLMVLYSGRIVESASVDEVFSNPRHPYTQGLLKSVPNIESEQGERLHAIVGQPPNLQHLPQGCAFQSRCEKVHERCYEKSPQLFNVSKGRFSACYLEQGS